MSEETTNVAGDETENEANNATEPTATADSADVQTTPADAAEENAAESAEPVADVTQTDGDNYEALEAEVAQDAMTEWSPSQESESVTPDSAESEQGADTAGDSAAAAAETAADAVEAAVAEPVAEAPEEASAADDAETSESGAEVPAATAEAAESVAADSEPTATAVAPEGAATDTAAAEAVATPERPRRRDGKRGARNANKRKLDTIEVGEELQGVVRSLQTYGAFVDVGAERDGLVHISELRDGFVEKVEDVVKEGDTVTVRVKEVEVGKGRLSLTMRPPRAPREAEQTERAERPRREERALRDAEADNRIKLRDLVEGATLTGKVTSIVDYGAFVDIGAATDGLVHISEIQEERVNKVRDVLSEGQEVEVRVLSVDKKRNRVSLSMKPAAEPIDSSYEYEDTSEDIEVASPMQDAFDRAREKKRRDRRGSDRSRKNRYDDDVDDIISRTLRWRD